MCEKTKGTEKPRRNEQLKKEYVIRGHLGVIRSILVDEEAFVK